MNRGGLLGVLLFVATLAIYVPVTTHEFLNYDDPEYVTANPPVLGGLSRAGVAWALTTTRPHNWHPMTWLSHMLDVELWGMNAGRHLLTNAVLHAVNTVLLFMLFLRMTGALWPSAFVAAVFGLHPMHVESVAWVAERKDVLSTFFWLLAASAYVRFAATGRRTSYMLLLLWFALAIMSKPMVVTFPFVLLLLDYWPLGRRRPLREKAPLFALAFLGGVVTVVAQRDQAMASLASVPLPARIAHAAIAYVTYLWKAVWPVDLAVFHPYPAATPAWQIGSAVVVLAVVSYLVLRQARLRPYLVVGWCWFLGMLAPVSGIAQAGVHAYADRYMYLPLVGLALIAAWGISDLLAHVRRRGMVLAITGTSVIVACALTTAVQLHHWRSSETLFRHTLAVTGDNFLAHNNLGEALTETGKLEEAAEHFAASVRLEPRFPHAHNNLAGALAAEGRVDEALVHYAAALRLAPDDPDAHRNLGLALYRRGDFEGAVEHLGAAVRLRPDDPQAHNNLAAALEKHGDLDQAIEHYAAAVRLAPDYERARRNLAAAAARRTRGRPGTGAVE